MAASTPTDAALELRRRTLGRLEDILRLLVANHGGRMTLAELLAIVAFMERACREETVSITDIAHATGLPKQSLSRWAKKRDGESIRFTPNPDDQRSFNISLIDESRGQAHLEQLAKLLNTD